MPILNTLRLRNRLTQHGMPDDQAQDLVDELDNALTTAVSIQVATKADVADLRGEMRERVGALSAKVTMIQWGLGLLVTAMIVGLAMLFSQQQRLTAVETRLTAVETRLTTMEATLGQLKTAVERLVHQPPSSEPPPGR